MAIPVFLTVSMIRNSIGMKSLDAAEEFNTSHSLLGIWEDFERVPDPNFLVSRNVFIHTKITEYIKKYGVSNPNPVISRISEKILDEGIYYCLMRDRIFHSLIPFLRASVLYGTSYGPIFYLMQKYFEAEKDDIFLKKTSDPYTDQLLLFAMQRRWGEYSVRRKIKKFNPDISFEKIDNNNYIGVVKSVLGDTRRIFWDGDSYNSKKQYFTYLFLYVLLKSCHLKFILMDNINTPKDFLLKMPLAEIDASIHNLEAAKNNYFIKGLHHHKPCFLRCGDSSCDYFSLYGPRPIRELYIAFESFLDGTFSNYCIRQLL
ncbi:MAG: hypothetical protein ACOY46_02840 [Bacillota bacterium]